ncbi:phosphoribosylformylglycinamidine cyclo-ligase [PVC group bacterium (ex Bugula neritina AB1)]|nr:phosphoribosylformylglycinamidine cyclo-ligase [PVC group bacterium (ex Bugula neritina AB1)]
MKKDSYKKSGVDIEAGNSFVENIKEEVASTYRDEVLGELGGFGGLFKLDTSKYKEPILVSGADGVGTKLKVAQMMNDHHSVGIDLVAMCVNDIVVQGAEPLFFLDYMAVGKLNQDAMLEVIKGVAKGCRLSGCSLIGGETAEMPGMYRNDDYDLAGFAVGVVEKSRLLTGKNIKAGDVLLGLPSSGLHSNGYSLVRKIIFEEQGLTGDDFLFEKERVGDVLLKPTRVYVKTLLDLMDNCSIKGLVHITGGGLSKNIPRVLPKGLTFSLNKENIPSLPIFDYLQDKGALSEEEMEMTFNCGIGMVVVVSPAEVDRTIERLDFLGESFCHLGEIVDGE